MLAHGARLPFDHTGCQYSVRRVAAQVITRWLGHNNLNQTKEALEEDLQARVHAPLVPSNRPRRSPMPHTPSPLLLPILSSRRARPLRA